MSIPPGPTLPASGADSAAPALEDIVRRHGLWRGRARHQPGLRTEPSGIPVLDAALPGGGWPRGALVELLGEADGRGAFSLIVPLLARLSAAGRMVALLAPPYRPYAPALAAAGVALSQVLLVRGAGEREQCWALEQSLRSGACALACAWVGRLEMTALRRLQLAAEAGDAMGFLLRPAAMHRQISAAALRLLLHPEPGGMGVDILKSRGAWPAGRIHLAHLRD